ncbi:hypothetical protein B0J14DRAFT_54885 [Halenospora varia]|nr:hypothetical protein B0J14DRAFT_54885 [Halenospora varia]
MWPQRSSHALPSSEQAVPLKNHPHTFHSSQALLLPTPRRRSRLQRKSKRIQPQAVSVAFGSSSVGHAESKQQQIPSTLGSNSDRRKNARTSVLSLLARMLPKNRSERGHTRRPWYDRSSADAIYPSDSHARRIQGDALGGRETVGYSSWYQTCLSPRTHSCKDSRSNSVSKCPAIDRVGHIATQPSSSTKLVDAPTNVDIITGDRQQVSSIIFPHNETITETSSEDAPAAGLDISAIEAQAEMTTQTCSEDALATRLRMPAIKTHTEAITQTNSEDLPIAGQNMSAIEAHNETDTQIISKDTPVASQDVYVIEAHTKSMTRVTISNDKPLQEEDIKEVRERRKSFRKSGDFLGVQGANPRTGCWDSSVATSTTDECYISEAPDYTVDQHLKDPQRSTQIANSLNINQDAAEQHHKSQIPKPCFGQQTNTALAQQAKESDTERRSREVTRILEDIEIEKNQKKQQEKQKKRQAVQERKARIEKRNEMSAGRRWVQSEDAWTSVAESLPGAIGQQLNENVHGATITTTSDARRNLDTTNPHTTIVQTKNAQTKITYTSNIPVSDARPTNTHTTNTPLTNTHSRITRPTNNRTANNQASSTLRANTHPTNARSTHRNPTNSYTTNTPTPNARVPNAPTYTTSTRVAGNENRQNTSQRISTLPRAVAVSASKDAASSESSTETVIHYNNITTNNNGGPASRIPRAGNFLGQQRLALKELSNRQ